MRRSSPRSSRSTTVAGILPLRSVYLESDPPCLEAPFVYGYDLAGLMLEWKWRYDSAKPEAALKLIRRLAAIVAEAHTRGMVHRDLKPSNILLRPSEDKKFTLWISDFGWGQIQSVRSLETGQGRPARRTAAAGPARRGIGALRLARSKRRRNRPRRPTTSTPSGVIWFQLLKRDPSAAAPVGTEWVEDLRPNGFTDCQARAPAGVRLHPARQAAEERRGARREPRDRHRRPGRPDRDGWLEAHPAAEPRFGRLHAHGHHDRARQALRRRGRVRQRRGAPDRRRRRAAHRRRAAIGRQQGRGAARQELDRHDLRPHQRGHLPHGLAGRGDRPSRTRVADPRDPHHQAVLPVRRAGHAGAVRGGEAQEPEQVQPAPRRRARTPRRERHVGPGVPLLRSTRQDAGGGSPPPHLPAADRGGVGVRLPRRDAHAVQLRASG